MSQVHLEHYNSTFTFFLSLIIHTIMHTYENLLMRRCNVPSTCSMCNHSIKSTMHICDFHPNFKPGCKASPIMPLTSLFFTSMVDVYMKDFPRCSLVICVTIMTTFGVI